MHARPLLTIAAYLNFALAALHVAFLFTGEGIARYFGAPNAVLNLVREGSWKLIPIVLLLALALGLFGLYCWSGSGRMRRLPLLKAVLLGIGVLYFLRGLLLIPQVYARMQYGEGMPFQFLVFDAFALLLAVPHLWGALKLEKAP